MPAGPDADSDLLLEERVVGIHLDHPGGQRFATGMLVAGDLVMTALHTFVRARNGGRCDQVEPKLPAGWRLRVAFAPLAERLDGTARQVEWRDAEILWPAEPASWYACDLALLRISGRPFRVSPLAVAASGPDELSLRGRFIGFPLADPAGPDTATGAADNMPAPIDAERHFLTARAPFGGELTVRDKVRNRRVLTIADGGEAPPGISGSVVLHQDRAGPPAIVGVISAMPSPSYSRLMEDLGRDQKHLVVALLGAALEDDALGALLGAAGITAAGIETAGPPALENHVALIDREETCAFIASAIGQAAAAAAGATGPRAILTLGYVGEDSAERAIEAIAQKLPAAARAAARRQRLTAPAVIVDAALRIMRMPRCHLPPEEIDALLDRLEGGLGRGPTTVVVPVIVAGEIAGPREAAICLKEMAALLRDLAPFEAPIVLLAFIERNAHAPDGAAVHERLRAGAAAGLPATLGAFEFMGDLEWIDEHAVAQWGAALLQVAGVARWSHVVKRHVSALENRVYRLYAACPEDARAYPRLRRVVELIAEIQTSSAGTPP